MGRMRKKMLQGLHRMIKKMYFITYETCNGQFILEIRRKKKYLYSFVSIVSLLGNRMVHGCMCTYYIMSFQLFKTNLVQTDHECNKRTIQISHLNTRHTETSDLGWQELRIQGHTRINRSNIHVWDMYIRRIYIANFAIFKIATFWSYHLQLRKKSRSFSFTKLRNFLVGSAHVHSQATVHAFMQRMQYAWGPRISIHVSKSARS